jgi:hypothetical protein
VATVGKSVTLDNNTICRLSRGNNTWDFALPASAEPILDREARLCSNDMMFKECDYCGFRFRVKHPLQLYCGGRCRHLAFVYRRRERRWGLSEERRRQGTRCHQCGQWFWRRKDAKFCSVKCKQAHWRGMKTKTLFDEYQ